MKITKKIIEPKFVYLEDIIPGECFNFCELSPSMKEDHHLSHLANAHLSERLFILLDASLENSSHLAPTIVQVVDLSDGFIHLIPDTAPVARRQDAMIVTESKAQ